MTTDKRKQSLYFPESMLSSIQAEAERLDRSLSWIVQRCVKIGLPELRGLPSTEDPPNRAPMGSTTTPAGGNSADSVQQP